MANLNENGAQQYNWEEGVYQIEKSDPVEGGPEGTSNRQGASLALRTRNLHERTAALEAALPEGDEATLEAAKTYADDREKVVRTDFVAADASTLEAARADASTKSEAALRNAKTYTEAREGVLRTDYANADAATLRSAKSYADQVVAALVDGSPEALNTLHELAKALGDDPNFATTIMTEIGKRVSSEALVAGMLQSASLGALCGSAPNLIQSPDYSDLSKWTIDPSIIVHNTYNDALCYGGRYVLIQNSVLSETWQAIRQTVPVRPNTSYTLMLDVAVLFGSRMANVAVTGSNLAQSIKLYVTDESYDHVILTFDSGSNEAVEIKLWTTGATITGRGYIKMSAIKLAEGAAPTHWTPSGILHSGNFNPDSKLSVVDGTAIVNGTNEEGKYPALKLHISGSNYSQFVMPPTGAVHLVGGDSQNLNELRPFYAGNLYSNWNRVYDTGNLLPATPSANGLMTAADKQKLDAVNTKVVAMGRVTSGGTPVSYYGSFNSFRSGEGYRIAHSLGTVIYFLDVIPYGDNNLDRSWGIHSQTNDYVEVYFRDGANRPVEVEFMFKITKFV